VIVPQPAGTAKGGDAALRGYACAREYGDGLSVLNPFAGLAEIPLLELSRSAQSSDGSRAGFVVSI